MQKFSYEYYSHLLDTAIASGYKVTSFEKYDDLNERTIILRHDIDYTLNGVLELATIESQKKITATYLFRVHADEYNLFSCVSISLINKLISMGHEIGLHFEAMNVGRAINIEPRRLLDKEKLIIESIIGMKVRTCSEHRELSGLIHNTPLFESLYDPYEFGFDFYAMDKRYSKEMKYLSDSNANWREGDPIGHYGKHSRMQILIHPDWWFESDLLLKGPYVHPRGI